MKAPTAGIAPEIRVPTETICWCATNAHCSTRMVAGFRHMAAMKYFRGCGGLQQSELLSANREILVRVVASIPGTGIEHVR